MDDMSGPERRTVLSATGSSRDCALAVGKILYSALQPYRNQWLIFRLRVPTSEHSGDRNLKLFPMHSTREVVKKDSGLNLKVFLGSIMLLPITTSSPTTIFTVPMRLKIRCSFLGPGILSAWAWRMVHSLSSAPFFIKKYDIGSRI
jgi:hypothetical protein